MYDQRSLVIEHSQEKIPPVVFLTPGQHGDIQASSANGQALSPLVQHQKNIAVFFVPVLMVQQDLVFNDYALYLITDKNNLFSKLESLAKKSVNAIVLIRTTLMMKKDYVSAYCIEEGKVLDAIELPCVIYYQIINNLRANSEGIIDPVSINEADLQNLIKYFLFTTGRGNEVDRGKAKTGRHLFSQDFAPCNAVVAKRKSDDQFVLYHATSPFIDKVGAGSKAFVEGIGEGGDDFIAVMAKPKLPVNYLKGLMITGRLAVELQNSNVNMYRFEEGYRGVACINGNTVIMTKQMCLYKDIHHANKIIASITDITDNQYPIGLLTLPSREIDFSSNDTLSLAKACSELIQLSKTEKNKRIRESYMAIVNSIFSLGLLSEDAKKEITKIEETQISCCRFM
ncbi:MAG: hypothetical protein LEGION0403_FIIPPAGN_01099 [Legionella sp.]|uniref:hypothetical protein n=1 Tax=Legionella sp. TaxID=459 RepID=UPI003D104C5D